MAPAKPSFLEELKRRHVMRAAIIYAAAVWALAQGISQLSPAFDLSTGVTFWFVIACVIGFPFWIAFAWYFKFTAHGVEREDDAVEDVAATRRAGRKLDYWIFGIMAVAIVLLLTNELVLQRGKTLREFAAAPTPAAKSVTKTPAATTPSHVTSMAVPIVAQPIPAKSVAVLPFENLSADKANAYFADGIQDLILTKLADIGDLKVIARTSTESYGSHPQNLTKVGKQLGVATILEGSVQKAGNQVLINVQLIDAKTDSHIWAHDYVRTLTNIFGVEGEVAGKVATALNAKLTAVEATQVSRVPTTNNAAYNLFLRAEYQFHRGVTNGYSVAMTSALPLYRQAVAADPDFALAWAKLSSAESLIAWFGGEGLNLPRLQAAAHADLVRALKFAPNLAATQQALGQYDYFVKGDDAGALKAFRAVLAVSPNNATAMMFIGDVLGHQYQFTAAIGELQRAFALDPRNASLAYNLGNLYAFTRYYDKAITALNRAAALDPGNASYQSAYARTILLGTGNLKRAWVAAQGDSPILQLDRTWILTLQRRYGTAITLLQSVPDSPSYFGLNGNNPFVGSGSKVQLLADRYRLADQDTRARPLYEKADTLLQAQLKAQADNAENLARVWASLADVKLGLGKRDAAIAAMAHALELATHVRSHVAQQALQQSAAYLYAQAGRADLAMPLITQFLTAPGSGGFITPALLHLAPQFDPIRHDPAFQALLKKYGKPQAAAATASTSAASVPHSH